MSVEAGPESSLRARAEALLGRITSAAVRVGRGANEVKLVAVTKTHPASLVREAFAAGLREFGENRVQEAEEKIEELSREASSLAGARWHLIGRLQANKARRAAKLFDVIHSVDSAALAERLERVCEEDGRERLDVLVQVDLAREAAKGGAGVDELPAIAETLKACTRLRFKGLMTLPPFYEDTRLVRPYFRRLRELRDGLRASGAFGDEAGELSMGMTHDFEVAIEEGATLVRVGTALFGERGARV
ncbi:MAG TPA: YggS family pyridoxal phosphate-dependent enzyme [Pyrinomonadaceae bacterium]|nr:YggS family pyridoxal phosphate-dependent enzyme [Pyrinomonadaceae bacterium]